MNSSTEKQMRALSRAVRKMGVTIGPVPCNSILFIKEGKDEQRLQSGRFDPKEEPPEAKE